MDRESVFLSAVLYVRDNIKDSAAFVRSLAGQFDSTFKNYEIVVVDDCSREDVRKELELVSGTMHGSLSVVRMSFPQGVQAALNAGVDIAIGDFVFEFESAVLDFEISLIYDVYKKALEGFDIVSAAPNQKMKFSSRIFYKIYNSNSGGQYPLSTERFRLVSRRAINRIESMSDNVVYRKAFYKNSGLKCDVVYYAPNEKGTVDSLPAERSKLATDSLILFTSVAYKLSLAMTIVMMLFAAFSGIYTVVVFLLGKPAEGWTTTMLFMSFAFFGVFAILTIIIKYLSVLVELNFKKNRYTIENVYKLN